MPYDIVIVGGGPGGLSAALALGRARKRVWLCDSGPRRNASAEQIHNFVTRELGTTLGVALLGAVFTTGHSNAIDSHLAGIPVGAADARKGIANALAADGAGPDSQALIRAAPESFVDGWQQAMWVGVGVMAVLLVVILMGGPQSRATGDAAAARWAPPAGPRRRHVIAT